MRKMAAAALVLAASLSIPAFAQVTSVQGRYDRWVLLLRGDRLRASIILALATTDIDSIEGADAALSLDCVPIDGIPMISISISSSLIAAQAKRKTRVELKYRADTAPNISEGEMILVPSGAAVAIQGTPEFRGLLTALSTAESLVIVEVDHNQWAFRTGGFHDGFVAFNRQCRPETLR